MAASDYMVPQGKLQASFLPGQDLAAFVTAWESAGTVKAEAAGLSGSALAAAVEAYVYWRGYATAAENMLATENTSRTTDGASFGFSQGQYDYWTRQAALYEAEWQSAIQEAGSVAPLPAPRTMSVTRKVVW